MVTADENVCALNRAVGIFKSLDEAKDADKKYYQSLTPAQRIDILLRLREQYKPYGDELSQKFVRVCRIRKLRNKS